MRVLAVNPNYRAVVQRCNDARKAALVALRTRNFCTDNISELGSTVRVLNTQLDFSEIETHLTVLQREDLPPLEISS